MARWNIENVRIAGVAAAVPRNVVYTTDFDFFTPEEAEVFNNTVGIKQRHIAPESVCASDLCFASAERLLSDLGWTRESVDVLIFESVTGDYKTPPTSCLLQDRLGLSEDCFSMDIPMGCCGCMYAITTGGNLLSSGNVKRALLLIGDTALRMGSMKDKVVDIAPYGPAVSDETKKLADAAKADIIAGKQKVFTGPLYDQSGAEKVPAGTTLTDKELLSMDWFVKGVDGKIQN